MKERLLKIMRSRITTSIIYILLGLCLVLMPVTTVYIIYKVVFGIVMITVGLYHIYLYLRNGRSATLLDMFSGSLLVVLGGFLISNPQIVVKLLPLLLGTFVLVDSVWSFQAAIRMKKNNLSAWAFVLTGSLIFVALGIVGMINPFPEVKYTIFFSGGVLLGNGAADLIYLLLIRYWKKTISSGEETAVNSGEESPAQTASQSQTAPGNAGNPQSQPVPGSTGDSQSQTAPGSAESLLSQTFSGNAGGFQPQTTAGSAGNSQSQPVSGNTEDAARKQPSDENAQKDSRTDRKEENTFPEPDLTLEPGILDRNEEDKKEDKEEEEILEEWKD